MHDESTETPAPSEETNAEAAPPNTGNAPRFSRALLALVAAVSPIATIAFSPAGSGNSAHSSPIYVLARTAHDVGHNDWAFQGGLWGRITWVTAYIGLGLFWLAIALWMRWQARRNQTASKLWLRVLLTAWCVELMAGLLTFGTVLCAVRTSTSLGPVMLKFADLGSPWWSCVAATLVVAIAERNTVAVRAATLYGILLAIILLVPLPGPDTIKALIIATTVTGPALLTHTLKAPSPLTSDAGESG